ncbi:uncharacterized protein [Dysidea avara]|uniref:uncharacterized protein isoform X2 n=1 Tax=Dysidea avara TaxID=196820 RepID=UPI00332B1C40
MTKHQQKKERKLHKKRNKQNARRTTSTAASHPVAGPKTIHPSDVPVHHVQFEVDVTGPHSDGKTNLLNWLSSGTYSNSKTVTSSHFTNPSFWSSDRNEVEQVAFVNSYVNVLINNCLSYLTDGSTHCDVSHANMYTAFICDVIGYSECSLFLKFLSTKLVTVVTFDVPQQQEQLPMTKHYLCTTLDNIDHTQNVPLLVVLVGIHSGVSCDMLDQYRNELLQCIGDKPYRRLLADHPSSAVVFYQSESCGDNCPLKKLIVDNVMKHPEVRLSSDCCDMLQRVRDTGVVAMTKKEFRSTYKGSCSLKQLSEDGVICYFSDCPSLQDVVFTSPHWLNTIITLLTSPPCVKGTSHTVDHSTGLVNDRLVDELLEQYSTSVSTQVIITDALMSLLVHVDLAVPQSASSAAGATILVPSLITSSCPPATLNTDTVFLFTITGGNMARIYFCQLLGRMLKYGLNEGHQLLSVHCNEALLQMMVTGHCYQLSSHIPSGIVLKLSQPHPPMSAELVQQLTDKQLQLIQLLQQWWKELCGDKAVSGLLCPLCKDQPHPLDYKPHPLNDQLNQVKVTPSVSLTEDTVDELPHLLSSQLHLLDGQPDTESDQPHPPSDQPHPQCNGQLVKLNEHSIMLMRSAAKKERDSRKGSDSGVQDSSCDKPPSGSHDRKPAQSGDAEGVLCPHLHLTNKVKVMKDQLEGVSILSCKECNNDDISVCLKCSQLYCENHVVKHQSSSTKKHFLRVKLSTMEIICAQCGLVTAQGPPLSQCVSYLDHWYRSCDLLTTVDDQQSTTISPVKLPVKIPVKGLPNMGNTCYFNSALQNIVHAPGLANQITSVFAERSHVLHAPPSLQLQPRTVTVVTSPGPITMALQQVMTQFGSQGGHVSPGPLLKQLCKRYKHFDGHRQQDSHELLRYLLDGMKMEEIERVKRAVLLSFGVGKDAKQSKFTSEDRMAIKGFGRSADNISTFVDEVFAGSLVSTVICHQCHTPSQMIEKFFDLSLPIPYKETSRGGKGGQQHRQRRSEEVTAHGKKSKKEKQREKQAKKKAKGKGKGQQQKKQTQSATHSSKQSDSSEDEAVEEVEHQQQQVETDQSDEDNNYTTYPIQPTPPSTVASNSLYDADHVRHHLQAKKLHYQPVNYNFGSHDLFSLEACLAAYTSLDILDGSNQFLCQVCSEAKGQRSKATAADVVNGNHGDKDKQKDGESDEAQSDDSDSTAAAVVLCDATKQLLVHQPPRVLLLQLKRFSYFYHRSSRKNNTHINFPILLDLAPYCSEACQGVRNSSGQILYALYGMVVHSGTMDHGHYIAYIRDGNHVDKTTKWYCVNDSHVSPVSIETVLSNQGYILFYELLN